MLKISNYKYSKLFRDNNVKQYKSVFLCYLKDHKVQYCCTNKSDKSFEQIFVQLVGVVITKHAHQNHVQKTFRNLSYVN